MSSKLIALTFLIIISPVRGPLGSALAVNQRSSMTKPSRAQLASVESGCSKGVLNSVALKLPLLAYPRQAARQGISGNVTIKVFVNETGARNDQPIKCTGLLLYKFNRPGPR